MLSNSFYAGEVVNYYFDGLPLRAALETVINIKQQQEQQAILNTFNKLYGIEANND